MLVNNIDSDDCQFDGQKMCFWKDQSHKNYAWQRIKGPTGSEYTGPDGDHTTQNTTRDGRISSNMSL